MRHSKSPVSMNLFMVPLPVPQRYNGTSVQYAIDPATPLPADGAPLVIFSAKVPQSKYRLVATVYHPPAPPKEVISEVTVVEGRELRYTLGGGFLSPDPRDKPSLDLCV